MKLNIMDRITLLGLLPTSDVKFSVLKTVSELRNSLLPSGNEVEEYGITETDGQVRWNQKGNEPVEIVISKLGTSLIVEELKKIDESEKGRIELLPVWEKFITEAS